MKIWRIEDAQLRLGFHPGQTKAWDSQERFVFIFAGTQGGKTSFLPWWLWREINWCGSGDYIAATSSYDLFKLKFLPEMREVFETILGIGRYWAGDKIIELKDPETGQFKAKTANDPMWGRIILRSAHSKSGLESATAKAAVLDECGQAEFTLETWEAVLRRLSLSQGRVLGGTTLYNLGWTKTEIYDKWSDGAEDIDVIQFPSYINPAFPRAEYDRAEGSMQDWRFRMFYKGIFSKPSGLIYKDFDSSMLVDAFEVPATWRRVVGLDFGGANTAKIYLAQNPKDERWYVYHEILSGGISTEDHAVELKKHLPDDKDNDEIDISVVGGAKSETQQRLDWSAAGVYVDEPSVWDVESGIDRTTKLIKSDKLRVFRNLKGLRDELGKYSRKVDPRGEPMDEIANKSIYHRLDALRYAAVYIYDPTPDPAGETVTPDIDIYTTERQRTRLWRR